MGLLVRFYHGKMNTMSISCQDLKPRLLQDLAKILQRSCQDLAKILPRYPRRVKPGTQKFTRENSHLSCSLFNLFQGSLQGSFPSDLTGLQRLNLSHSTNILSSLDSNLFQNNSLLVDLDLSHLQLSGTSTNFFQGLKRLKSLNLQGATLTGVYPLLFSLLILSLRI